jgi:hypothetical protein
MNEPNVNKPPGNKPHVNKPLAGLLVVAMEQAVAAPLCSMKLAEPAPGDQDRARRG